MKFKAEKIIKTSDSIIGKDNNGKEIFSFKGITDFSLFILEDNQKYDTEEIISTEDRIEELEASLAELSIALAKKGVL